jgi:acyl-CoA synthetase (AMP-forming)/AMP-acid ligase II
VVIPPTRNPAELAVLIRREEISLVSGPPSLFVALLAEKVDGHSACSALRYAGTGSANVSAALVRDLYAQGLSVVSVGYGMTECDTISSTRLSDSAETIATTVGRPLDGLDIQITDESGAAVASGVEGEIWIRGYMVASAYLGENGQYVAAIDAQGWLHTGDIGRFTTEGNLQILGRKKDVMSIHGYTLYPAEIEALLSRSGMLREVAVVGVPHALAGEISVAFIVPEDTAAFSLKRLRLWARAHIADYKIPGRFLIVESLPLNRNGKVDRLALKHSLSHPEHKDTSQQ